MRLILHPNTPQQQTFEIERAATIGSAPENTVVLDAPGVAPFHARIVRDAELWIISNLAAPDSVWVDDSASERAVIANGSTLKIGSAHLLALTLEQDETAVAARTVVELPVTAQTMPVVAPQTICSQCGSTMHAAMQFCPSCGAEAQVRPAPEPSIGILPRLAFVCALCGPLLLGIGWLVGLIMALSALLRARRTGADRHERRIAWWAVAISLVWVGLLGIGALWLTWNRLVAVRVAVNEAAAQERLRGIALGQFYVKQAELYDADQDQVSEYVPLAVLATNSYHLLPSDITGSGEHDGYLFMQLRADENGFVCVATPLRYGFDGLRSFWVDERGRILAKDVAGRQLDKEAIVLATAVTSEPIFNDLAEELAGDVGRAAEAAFKRGEYERCKRIITTVRTLHPQTAAAQRLTTLEQSADPFLIDLRARELLERAETMHRQNLIDPAIETLRALMRQFGSAAVAPQAAQLLMQLTESRARELISQAEAQLAVTNAEQALQMLQECDRRYPEASVITTLKERIAACETEVLKQLESAAQKMIVAAREVEAKGDYEEAYTRYLTIKNRYGKTSAAADIDDILAKNRRMIEELEAGRLVDEIMRLTPERDGARITGLLDLLRRGYVRTEQYQKNEATLTAMQRTCDAQRYMAAAREQLAKKSYRAALASIELAMNEDPNIAVTMGPELERCYVELGNAAYENQDYPQALTLYEQYLKLQPKEPRLDTGRLMECYRHVAKVAFQAGDYAGAEKQLQACNSAFAADPAYNYVYGRTLMNLGRWQDAAQRFAQCIATNSPHAREARVSWAYCQYRACMYDEEMLRSLLTYDEDFRRMLRDYGVVFRSELRTGEFEIVAAPPAQPTGTRLFLDLTLDVCDQLEKLAAETERLTQLEKSKVSDRLTQRIKVRGMIQELPNQLNILRASASAEAYRKQRIYDRLVVLRKGVQTLCSALSQMTERSRTAAILTFTTNINDKLSSLRKAEDNFSLYIGLEEQRRRTVISIVENVVGTLTPTFVNASVIKSRADDLRALFASPREIDLAVQALRAMADAYSIAPSAAALMLAEPTLRATSPPGASVVTNAPPLVKP